MQTKNYFQHIWKYNFQIELLSNETCKLVEHNFRWETSTGVRKIRGKGIKVYNDFNYQKSVVMQFSPDRPLMKEILKRCSGLKGIFRLQAEWLI